ncbi:hypothetical protein BpHYR1_043586 [Brachionus plicatilis]|uniref:Uncharacterized protein n=1 Tax=Brachionus plicatilis TaxID=10195 RepID=A0A3M7T0K9_BRAPC|nr:hypothetical protein BpHYR1_043586 [Brachionus plicatilis]
MTRKNWSNSVRVFGRTPGAHGSEPVGGDHSCKYYNHQYNQQRDGEDDGEHILLHTRSGNPKQPLVPIQSSRPFRLITWTSKVRYHGQIHTIFICNNHQRYLFQFMILKLFNFRSCISYQGLQNSANLAEIRFQCVQAMCKFLSGSVRIWWFANGQF